ncbi:hypothetical protein NL676_020930 [Syzygium grande]|nr:hypothetical protein NL676_020930 [Syzygium grande]
MELSLPSHLACNPTPSAQLSKAVARVSPASLSGSASRIRLFSTGSKSRGFVGDSPARSPGRPAFRCSPEQRGSRTGIAGDRHRWSDWGAPAFPFSITCWIHALAGTIVLLLIAVLAFRVGSVELSFKQLASHGLFDVHVRATGDIHIDNHHTNEDVALAIGTAFLQTLGERKGIHRFGDFSAPLDEALIQVALDLSGWPHLSFDLQIPTQRVGMYDTQLVEHFFQSLVNTSGMTLHIS